MHEKMDNSYIDMSDNFQFLGIAFIENLFFLVYNAHIYLLLMFCKFSIYDFAMRLHYENRPMQYTENNYGCKNEKFHRKKIFFLFLLKT